MESGTAPSRTDRDHRSALRPDGNPGNAVSSDWVSAAKAVALIVLLTVAAVLTQGYHFGTDDAAIYTPAVERFASPKLFPFGAAFFMSHAHMSMFSEVVGGSVRWLHLPLQWAVLLFHIMGVFLLLLGGHLLARLCFANVGAQWAATLMLACVISTPVAGTALSIMDPYLTARTLSTPLTVLALSAFLARRPMLAVTLVCATALLHPLMAVFSAAMLILLALSAPERKPAREEQPITATAGFLLSFPAVLHFGAAQEPYRQTLYSRDFLFAWSWSLAEWMGVILPIAIFGALAVFGSKILDLRAVRVIRVVLVLGILSTAAFLFISANPLFDNLIPLQPMRSFQVIYIVMFLILGGLAGKYLLQDKVWRWVLFYTPICLVTYHVDRAVYPASEHLELPGRATANSWVQAFQWVRENTPQDAVFALPPRYIALPGEDTHGFRAIAERSMLADALKDSGVASVFPQMAPEWFREQQLTEGWDHYTAKDFAALASRSPVTWVMVEPKQAGGLDCPYHNAAVFACRL